MKPLTLAVMEEAFRHIYGGPCGKPGCVMCEELPKVQAHYAAEDKRNAELVEAIMDAVKGKDR